MRRIAFVSAFVLAAATSVAPAQGQETLLTACSTLTATATPPVPGGVPQEVTDQFRFVCGQVVNALTNTQPSIGIAFSGGNHTLGTATTIGRRLGLFPRISVTARLNAAIADVPDVFGSGFGTITEGSEVAGMPTTGLPVAALQADAVVGLFNGISLGPTFGGVGSVDLLGSVSFIPAIDQVKDAIGLEEDIVNIGLGARVGILKQGLLMPGVSVSGMYRRMGEVTFGDLETPDPAAFSTDLTTLSLRAAVSKGLLMFDVAAGAGYDLYASDVAFNWNVNYTCPPSRCLTEQDISLAPNAPVSGELKTAAWNVFANAGLSLLLLNVVGEVGYQKATEIVTAAELQEAGLPNQAPTEEDLTGGRFFASIGLRLTI